MSRRISVGDTVIIVGGNHRGKQAIILACTPKMFYIKLTCSGDETRIMAYNVKKAEISSATISNCDVYVLDLTARSERALIPTNDNEVPAEMFEEIRKMKKIVEQLTALLQKFQFNTTYDCIHLIVGSELLVATLQDHTISHHYLLIPIASPFFYPS
jgi:hypothetical protein